MKKSFRLFGIVAAVFSGVTCLWAQGPTLPVPTTRPAKPPVIAVPPRTEGDQVDVPVPGSSPGDKQTPPATSPQPVDSPSEKSPERLRGPFVIGPEDVLLIRVWGQPDLSGQVSVGPDGMISLQLIDQVKAEGLTQEQLKASLTQRLKSFIVNPDVNVQVLRVNSRKFIIQGEVNRTGTFPLTGPTTLMEALVSAQGFREFAKTNKIYVLRTEIDPKTKKREVKKYNFNYKEVSHGKHMEQDILVMNGDQIFVP